MKVTGGWEIDWMVWGFGPCIALYLEHKIFEVDLHLGPFSVGFDLIWR